MQIRRKRSYKMHALIISACILLVATASAYMYLSSSEETSRSSPDTEVVNMSEEDVREEQPDTEEGQPSGIIERMHIPTLGIDAPAVPLDIEPSGELAAPESNHEVGWWQDGTQPGEGENGRAVLMDGHVGLPGDPAVFADLHAIDRGAEIILQLAGGEAVTYTVYYVEQKPIDEVDMRRMLRSVNPNREGLNIITCAGEFDTGIDTYTDRVLVYAVRS